VATRRMSSRSGTWSMTPVRRLRNSRSATPSAGWSCWSRAAPPAQRDPLPRPRARACVRAVSADPGGAPAPHTRAQRARL